VARERRTPNHAIVEVPLLTGKQRRALRSLGHHLNPVVQIGKEGVTDAVVHAADVSLADHELIKVKVSDSAPVDRHDAADSLAEATASAVAQVLGRTILLFRRHPDEPKIALPGMPLPQPPKADEKKTVPSARRSSPSPRTRRPKRG
jgi:RNA-binding protein